jgi:hypothetical protein
MLNGVIILQSIATFPGGAFGDLLSKWEQAGFFSYILPFLLIFALVFGILTRIKIFKDNKAVNGIIALAVALMALQFGFVSDFFSQIFPRLGIGLAIILGIMIMIGLFADPDSPAINLSLLGIGFIIIIVIIIKTAGALGWRSGQWWAQNWQIVLGALVLLALIVIIIASATPKKTTEPFKYRPHWVREG